jgi:hypothetical protein
MHLSAEDPGCDNWERESRVMVRRGRHRVSGWGSWIDFGQMSLRSKTERTTNQQNKEKPKQKQKQKHKNEKQTKTKTKTKGRKVNQRGRNKQKQRRKANKIDECLATAS